MLLGIAWAWAGVPAFAPTETRIRFEDDQRCYGSGLRMHFLSDDRASLANVVTVVDAGAEDEPEGKSGVAKLVERLWFRSAAPGGERVASVIARVGGHRGLVTNDFTAFVTSVAPDALEVALRVESLRFTPFLDTVDEATFAAERLALATEVRRAAPRDVGALADTIYGRLFRETQRYRIPVHPSAREVEALSLADAQAFVASYYRPDNTTVHLTGAVRGAEQPGEIERAWPLAVATPADGPRACPDFAPSPQGPPAPDVSSVPAIAVPVPDEKLILAFSIPGGWSGEAFLAELATNRLEGVLRTRLAPDERIGPPKCWVSQGRDASVTFCSVSLLPGADAAEAERRIRSAIRAGLEEPLLRWDDAARRLAVGGARGAALWLTEGVSAPIVTDDLDPFFAAHTHGDADLVAQLWSFFDELDQRTILGFTATWFTPARAVLVHVRPVASEAASEAVGRVDTALPLAASVSREEIVARAAGPDARTFRLDNGLRVVVVPFGGVPVVAAELIFAGGDAVAPVRGVWDIVEKQEQWRLRNTDVDLDRALATAGLVHTTARRPRYERFRVTGPSDRLEEVLWVLRRRIGDARLRVEARPAVRVTRAAAPGLDDPDLVALRLATEAVFGADAWPDRKTWETAAAFERSRQKDWLVASRQASRATLIVVGAVEPGSVVSRVTRAFGAWPVRTVAPLPETASRLAADVAPRGVFMAKEAPGAARVVFVCPVDALDPVSRRVLGAGLSARLVTSLGRGISVQGEPQVRVREDVATGVTLEVAVQVTPSQVGPAVLDVQAQLAAVGASLDGDTVRGAALETAVQEQLGRSTVEGMVDTLRMRVLAGDLEEGLASRAAALADLPAAPLGSALRRCATEAGWAVLGAEEGRTSLQAAGLDFRTEEHRAWRSRHLEP